MPEIADKTDELSAKQHKALACLLSEPTIGKAAEKAGIAERTLHGWLQEPAFDAAYRAARRDAVDHAIARLQRMSSLATAVLESIMGDREKPASTRVAAAKAALDYVLKIRELEELEQRVAALEARDAQKH